MAQVEFPVGANTGPAVKQIDELIAALRKAGKEAGLTDKQIDEMVKSAEKSGSAGAKGVGAINKEMGTLQANLRNVAQGFAGLIAVDQLVSIAKRVVDVRSQFEKLEAVLTNTLGSKSRAQDALRMIQDFATKTPFSVLQLTDAYVKLANQGFRPTIEQMRKLGDLASSTGKGFDQLTEAIIDAQTGEFERLKDFGIRASKAGDQVTFSFKEVATTTEFTAESIREYLLSLGDLEGVSGAMVAISSTLDGKLNNLQDSFDKLANLSGQKLSPGLGFVIDDLNNIISILTAENLGKLEKMALIFGGTSEQRATVTQILEKERERLKLEKERTIVATVNAALTSGNVEAYIKALDQNIYKEEIIARIREHQSKVEKDKAEASAKALELQAKAYEKVKEKADEYLKTINQAESTDFGGAGIVTNELIDDKTRSQLNSLLDDIDSQRKQAYDLEFDETVAHNERILDEQRKAAEQRKEAVAVWRDYTIQALNEVLRTFSVNTEVELIMLDKRYQQELELAGSNEAAREKISEDFEKRKRALQIKLMQQEQEAAVFNILVNQGPAIAKTASQLGAFAGPFIAAMIGLFALQLNNTRKLAKARFAADGDFDIEGPGTETSDSIPYFLSRRESVVHARGTKRFGSILKPMIEDPNFDWHDLRRIVDTKLSTQLPRIQIQSTLASDSIKSDLKDIKNAIVNKKEVRLQFDEDGFGQWIGQQGHWTKIERKRYSL